MLEPLLKTSYPATPKLSVDGRHETTTDVCVDETAFKPTGIVGGTRSR